MKPKIVHWRDSQMYIEQEPIQTEWKICTIVSVGFLVAEDKEKIVLAGDVIGKDARRVLVIPKENIISIK